MFPFYKAKNRMLTVSINVLTFLGAYCKLTYEIMFTIASEFMRKRGIMEKKKWSVYQITFMALMAAVTCILGPLSLPIGPVPVSLTNLVVYFTVYVLGTKDGTISYCLYLLLGAVGLPVFSGYAGGLGKLAGPTGGYLVGFIAMALIGGMVMEKSHRKIVPTMAGWVAATAVDYLLGTIWFVYVAHYTVMQALAVCVFPFIIGDCIKIVLGTLLGREVRKALVSAGFIKLVSAAKKEAV